MARIRNDRSQIPFGGLGLEKHEEVTLQRLLKKKEYSLAKLKRYLIREWMKQQQDPKSGVLKFDK